VSGVQKLKDLVRGYNLAISPHRLGQHFLVEERTLTRLAEQLSAGPGDRVLEIGPGLGALTGPLLASGATVYAVERDARFVDVLTDRFKENGCLQLVRSDILRVDLGAYAMGEPHSLLVAGNIPYSLTSPILEFLVRQRQWVRRAVLTLQKEVAQRIVAKPSTKAYSSLSLFVAVAFKPSIVFYVPPGQFYPRPKVTSAVLRLDPLPVPVIPPEEEKAVLQMTRALFIHRRKTILNGLLSACALAKPEILIRLRKAGIDPIRRPETLTLPEVLSVSQSLR
jgi:16S rRNA (adenine1518-N6/adenine1519-N6)-dimethyltransferase